MKPSVYLETSIVSYLTARASRDLIAAGLQEETRQWWETRRRHFHLVIARPVLVEAALGDPDAARLRLKLLQGLRSLPLTPEAEALTGTLMSEARLPRKAELDAAHIAIATVNNVEYLLTLNCKHIASAIFRPRVESVCRKHGLRPPDHLHAKPAHVRHAMPNDPIIAEVRKNREAYAKRHGFDIGRIFADLRKSEKESATAGNTKTRSTAKTAAKMKPAAKTKSASSKRRKAA